MTILSGFDTHNPDYKSGNFICPRCGMNHVVDTMEIKPATKGLESRYLDIKVECGYEIPNLEDLQMNICSNCGLMWMDNEGVYSTSQLISYLFTSMTEILEFIQETAYTSDEKDIALRDELIKAIKGFCIDNSLDSNECDLDASDRSPSSFRSYAASRRLIWLNRILKGASPDDIVDIYNSWIKCLGKYANEVGCAPVSGRIDSAINPYIDEVVEEISTDKMEILNDE